MTALALGGWTVAAVLLVHLLRARCRLEFAARAQHEVRGPLAAIALGLDSLRRDGSQPVRRRAAALALQVERARLGLDDLAAARRGARSAASREQVRLAEVAGGVVEALGPAAARAGGRVRFDWRAGRTAVGADRGRLVQVLSNLVSNAVEHGGGEVSVIGRRSLGGVRIEVTDAGPGFGAAPRHGRRAGRGRGLAVAARGVDEAGGTMSVRSSERGATVAIELPAQAS